MNVQVMRGAFIQNRSMISISLDRCYNEVNFVHQPEEGIQVDGSFHQHGPELLAGSYGADFTATILGLLQHASGTSFYMNDDLMASFLHLILDGQQWMVAAPGRGNYWDFSVTGRGITRDPGISHANLDPSLLRNVTSNRTQELYALAARQGHDPGALPLLGVRHFYDSDYTVIQRGNYTVSIRMFSQRTVNARCVNQEVSCSLNAGYSNCTSVAPRTTYSRWPCRHLLFG